MFWIVRFILEWLIWLMFADKKRWREIFPVSIFSGFIAGTTDIIVNHYRLWQYDDHTSMIPELVNTWGMYIVVVYLFIQWLPKQKSLWRMFGYWFLWIGAMVTVEWIHVHMGHMSYPLWWRMYHSYTANWILFTLFYQYYKIFKFERLR